jgi:hypothetical protein
MAIIGPYGHIKSNVPIYVYLDNRARSPPIFCVNFDIKNRI